VWVKICCIQDLDEVRLAVRLGATAIGLVSAMPSGPGVISEERIAGIAPHVPPGIDSFLLTSLTQPSEIVAQHRRCKTSALQLCDRLEAGAHAELRAALPGVSIVQVVHVIDRESVAEALAVGDHVDALLLDSGNRDLAARELGGTGRTHDWQLSAEIRERAAAPVFLAGGLTSENVGAAIHCVEPHGVDVCSGVRTAGRLDEGKLAAFFAAVRAA